MAELFKNSFNNVLREATVNVVLASRILSHLKLVSPLPFHTHLPTDSIFYCLFMLQEDMKKMKKTKDHRIQEEKLQSMKAKETTKIRSLKLF